MQGIRFLGTGSFLPETTLTNNDLSKFIETNDEWIFTRTGIKARHFNIGSTNFMMAAEAAKKAIADSGLDASEIDMIIVSTCTPDFFYPSESCIVQYLTNAVNASCIDINSACTGFISALDMASRYLNEGDHKYILIVASEMLSNHVDYEDRGTCVLFGDGAAAAVVTADYTKSFHSFLAAEGDFFQQLYCKANYEPNLPIKSEENLLDDLIVSEQKKKYLQMDGKGVYKFAVDAMAKAVTEVCNKSGTVVEDIDLIIPHQANIRIIKSSMKLLQVSDDKVYTNIESHANISSACIPMCLDELRSAGKIDSGMKVCFVGFGAGLTYGAVLLDI